MNIPINSYITIIALFGILIIPFQNDTTNSDPGSIELGRQIYQGGIGENNSKITATLLGREMSATVFPCSNCHGECGEAQLQQGMDIPAISRKEYIKRNFGSSNPEIIGKKVNYSLKRFITQGINHSGVKVKSMMPTYNMSLDDINHLLSYLEILGSEEKCVKK